MSKFGQLKMHHQELKDVKVQTKPQLPSSLQFLSEEQKNVIFSQSRCVQIRAYAGSGKTTLLVALSHFTQSSRGLYLAFNESIAKQAVKKFPDHVQCMTSHSMALKELLINPSFRHIPSRIGDIEISHVKFIMDTHFPDIDPIIIPEIIQALYQFFSNDQLTIEPNGNQVQSISLHIWKSFFDDEGQTPIPHDAYLKIWALYPPRKLPYDFIMVDEAQDSNWSIISGLLKQNAKLFFVGDPFQSIYSYRGSINAFSMLPEDSETFYLTKTHRFGNALVPLADALIRLCDSSAPGLKATVNDFSFLTKPPLGENYLYLTRTNYGIFDKIIQLTKNGIPFCCISGLGFLNKIIPIINLIKGEKISYQGQLFATIENFDQFLSLSNNDGDQQMRSLVSIARKYYSEWDQIQEKIKNLHQPTGSSCIHLSTVHQAKGLEFSWVQLGEDFPFPFFHPPVTVEDYEEIHIFYVAITRAKEGLIIESQRQLDWVNGICGQK